LSGTHRLSSVLTLGAFVCAAAGLIGCAGAPGLVLEPDPVPVDLYAENHDPQRCDGLWPSVTLVAPERAVVPARQGRRPADGDPVDLPLQVAAEAAWLRLEALARCRDAQPGPVELRIAPTEILFKVSRDGGNERWSVELDLVVDYRRLDRETAGQWRLPVAANAGRPVRATAPRSGLNISERRSMAAARALDQALLLGYQLALDCLRTEAGEPPLRQDLWGVDPPVCVAGYRAPPRRSAGRQILMNLGEVRYGASEAAVVAELGHPFRTAYFEHDGRIFHSAVYSAARLLYDEGIVVSATAHIRDNRRPGPHHLDFCTRHPADVLLDQEACFAAFIESELSNPIWLAPGPLPPRDPWDRGFDPGPAVVYGGVLGIFAPVAIPVLAGSAAVAAAVDTARDDPEPSVVQPTILPGMMLAELDLPVDRLVISERGTRASYLIRKPRRTHEALYAFGVDAGRVTWVVPRPYLRCNGNKLRHCTVGNW